MSRRVVLVAGAGGAVGFEIVRALRADGCDVVATYRTRRDGVDARLSALGARAVRWDMADETRGRALLADVDGAVFVPILTASERAAALAPDKRLVFFSSNNIAIDPQAPVYAALRAAEDRVRAVSPAATILRPTMIYGYPGDGNLSVLMRAMRRAPLTPMIGNSRALQQPVFYRDLARAAADLVASDGPAPDTVAVAGPTPVTQGQLYRAVRDAAGGKGALLPVPAPIAGAAARAAAAIGLRPLLTPAQIKRANRDKTPVGDNVLLGATALAEGLRELAGALDAAPPGA